MLDLEGKIEDDGATADGRLPAAEWNNYAAEAQRLVEETGQVLTAGSAEQVVDAISMWATSSDFFDAVYDSVDTYDLTTVEGAGPELPGTAGDPSIRLHVRFRPDVDNTAALTLITVNGSSAYPVFDSDFSAIAAGDITADEDVELLLVDLFPVGTVAVRNDRNYKTVLTADGVLARGSIDGFLSASGPGFSTDAQHVKIFAGECRDQNDIIDLVFAATWEKSIDATWSAGDLGGLAPSGLPEPKFPRSGWSAGEVGWDQWYRIFAIGKVDGTVDFGIDTWFHPHATLLMQDATPSGFVSYRQIGWLCANGGLDDWRSTDIGPQPEIVPFYTTGGAGGLYFQLTEGYPNSDSIGLVHNEVQVRNPHIGPPAMVRDGDGALGGSSGWGHVAFWSEGFRWEGPGDIPAGGDNPFWFDYNRLGHPNRPPAIPVDLPDHTVRRRDCSPHVVVDSRERGNRIHFCRPFDSTVVPDAYGAIDAEQMHAIRRQAGDIREGDDTDVEPAGQPSEASAIKTEWRAHGFFYGRELAAPGDGTGEAASTYVANDSSFG